MVSGPGSTTNGSGTLSGRRRNRPERSTAGRDERDNACRTGDRSGRTGADGLGTGHTSGGGLSRRARALARRATPRAGRTGQGGAANSQWYNGHGRHPFVNGTVEGRV